MLDMLFNFEDQMIKASRGASLWDLTVKDNLTGVENTVEASDIEMGAVMGLAFGLDEAQETGQLENQAGVDLYAIAEPVMHRLHDTDNLRGTNALRIIP